MIEISTSNATSQDTYHHRKRKTRLSHGNGTCISFPGSSLTSRNQLHRLFIGMLTVLWGVTLLPLYGQETHPVLDWSTYFGGSTRNDALKYVVDDDGSIWFGSLVAHDGAGVPTTSDAWQND